VPGDYLSNLVVVCLRFLFVCGTLLSFFFKTKEKKDGWLMMMYGDDGICFDGPHLKIKKKE